MKYEELAILLPCHSLEDFPLHHEGEEADNLLACWTAMWHPALIASAGKIPSWHRVDDPPEDMTDRLVVVPTVSQAELPTGFVQRAKSEAACVIRTAMPRDEMLDKALAPLGERIVSDDLALDFLALGYCYLQVELLTRQMRYASNLDEVHFQNQVVAAATAAVEGNHEEVQEKLVSCFDILAEEREHYYPVDAFVLDLTMLAPTTLGALLQNELGRDGPANLLLSGELLSQMADEHPASLEAVRQAVEGGRATIVGGEHGQRMLSLTSLESLLRELRLGRQTYQQHLSREAQVFGRRRFGLTPMLPQVLNKFGMIGALHATLDDGRFPEGSQTKVRWEGSDGAAIDAVARAPLDAAKPETYLGFAVKMGESMDMDHVATVCLTHWPSGACVWHEDLRRVARHTSALGKLVTLEEYFRDTDLPGQLDRFEADQYRSPYMKQAIIRRHVDPISRVTRYWRRQALSEAADALTFMTQCISHEAPQAISTPPAALEEDAEMDDEGAARLMTELESKVQAAAERFSKLLPRTDAAAQQGYLALNPCSFVRRTLANTPKLPSPPQIGKPIYACGETKQGVHAVVDVPPMGFVWIDGAGKRGDKRPPAPLAEENVLRNEFFEAFVHPETGGLRAVRQYNTRGNRLSQQLALRLPGDRRRPGGGLLEPDDAALYTVMAADSIKVTQSTPAVGEIVAKGRLMSREGKKAADFVQTYRILRGSRVLHLEIELTPHEEPPADPWNAYYCSRFAWSHEAAELWRGVSQTRHRGSAKYLEAPHYIEIDEAPNRTAILTGGLPYHRRTSARMLDTLLIVPRERARKFHLGVGVELSHPLHEAMSLMAPLPLVSQQAATPTNTSGWLFHIDAKNVVATHWSPLIEDGKPAGYRVRLLETMGRAAKAKISGVRPAESARQVDFRGEPLSDCQINEGAVCVELAGGEWVEVEARW